jgi:hypothetical protein
MNRNFELPRMLGLNRTDQSLPSFREIFGSVRISTSNKASSDEDDKQSSSKKTKQSQWHCDICKCYFTRKNDLSTHIKILHSKESEVLTCSVSRCKSTFQRVSDLTRHRKTIHRTRQYTCRCDRSFRRKDTLKRYEHYAVHTDLTC